jgi:two-component system LytT family response regulator
LSERRITVLVVDDEPPARRKLLRFLAKDSEMEVVGEAGSGTQAIERIRELQPQLVFLDIQMPKVTGFGVLEALDAEGFLPEIIFVTAHDQYAVQAFEVAALDYLLKPFDAGRFQQALDRAKARILARPEQDETTPTDRPEESELHDRIGDLLAQLGRGSADPTTRILVKDRDRARFVSVDQIRCVRAAGNYVELFAEDEVHMLRDTLDGIAERLDAHRFLRVHRSYLVNVDHIKEIQPLTHGDHLLILTGDTEVRLSRRYRDQLPQDVFGGL